jgi:hypothetical protein
VVLERDHALVRQVKEGDRVVLWARAQYPVCLFRRVRAEAPGLTQTSGLALTMQGWSNTVRCVNDSCMSLLGFRIKTLTIQGLGSDGPFGSFPTALRSLPR